MVLAVPRKGVPPAISQVLTFIARRVVSITKTLAYSVDSLVRVSRRLVKDRVPRINPGVPAEVTTSIRVQMRSIYLPIFKAENRSTLRSKLGLPPRTSHRVAHLLSFPSRTSTALSSALSLTRRPTKATSGKQASSAVADAPCF